jgi:hypothetical protein
MHSILSNLLQLQEWMRNGAAASEIAPAIKRVRARLPESVLRDFDHLLAHHPPAVAVLTASDGCDRCHLRVPRDNALRIRLNADLLHVCPHCHCWLYAPPAPGSKPRSPAKKRQPSSTGWTLPRDREVSVQARRRRPPGNSRRKKMLLP